MSDEAVPSGSVFLAPPSARLTLVPQVPDVLVSNAFWLYWLDVAIDQLEAAVSARREGLEARASGEDVARFLLPETKAGMVGAVAAAACVESFAGRVASYSRALPSVAEGPSAKFAHEVLRRSFYLNEPELETRLRGLFDDRNRAIHAKETANPPEMHPLGILSGSGHADFTMERAAGAVQLAVGILEGCISSVRDGTELAEVAEMMSRQAENIRRSAERARLLVEAM